VSWRQHKTEKKCIHHWVGMATVHSEQTVWHQEFYIQDRFVTLLASLCYKVGFSVIHYPCLSLEQMDLH